MGKEAGNRDVVVHEEISQGAGEE